MAESVQMIKGEQLCVLTGLTDMRHRQLANEGYFPKPADGLYQLVATVQGMFRYYREARDKAKGRLTDLKEKKLERETERIDLENKKLQGKMVEISSVNERDLHLATLQKTLLYERLGNELGPRGEGRSAAELNAFGLSVADEVCDVFVRGVEEWKSQLAS